MLVVDFDIQTFDTNYEATLINDFSIAGWFKHSSTAPSSETDGIISNHNNSDAGMRVDLQANSGNPRLAVRMGTLNSSGEDSTGGRHYYNDHILSFNQWYFFVWTKSSTAGSTLQVNDFSPQTSASFTGSIGVGSAKNLEWGGYWDPGSGFMWDGNLSEIAIWTGSLSQSSFDTLYNGGHPIDLTTNTGNYEQSSSLLMYLSATSASHDGTNWQVHDLSGHRNSGSSVSMASSTLIQGDYPLPPTTASLNYVYADEYSGTSANVAGITNYIPSNAISSSTQIASDVSGSFNKGFALGISGSGNLLSGSSTSTASLSNIYSDEYSVTDISGFTNYIPSGMVSGSAQIASDVSGSHTSGFRFTGFISGSSTSTASLSYVYSDEYSGDVAGLTGAYDNTSTVSSSAQIASDISGSFTSGFKLGFNTAAELNDHPTIKSRGSGVYSTAGALGTARYNAANTNQGNSTNVMVMGGQGPTNNLVEAYDGTSWVVREPLLANHFKSAGAGTQNAALNFGGGPGDTDDETEEYNGTSWAAGGALITGRGLSHALGGSGTQNAGLAFSGNSETCTEEYNGVSWAAGGARSVGVNYSDGVGTQNDTIAAGSEGPSYTCTCTEHYDGTAWSVQTAMLVDKEGSGLFGTSNAAVIAGGYDYAPGPGRSSTEQWNGSTWSTDSVLPEVKLRHNAGGTMSSGVVVGGQPNASGRTFNYTQDYIATASFSKVNATHFQTEEITITGSAVNIPVFGSTFNVDTRHRQSSQPGRSCSGSYNDEYLGSNVAGQLFVTDDGRLNFTYPTSSVGYNPDTTSSGSYGAWSVGPTINVARRDLASAKASSQDAALVFGGCTPGTTNKTEEYDGLAWSEGNNMITARKNMAGAGTQNAALAMGGYQPVVTCTEEYNGSNWAAGGALIAARGAKSISAGSVNAAIYAGGRSGPNHPTATEHYNGISWSAGGSMPTGKTSSTSMGVENAVLATGGTGGSPANLTVEYNGINWSSDTNVTTARQDLEGAGSQNAAAVFGGHPAANNGICTEEYNGTSWTNSGAAVIGTRSSAGGGTNSQGIMVGGNNDTDHIACTQFYNGGTFHGTLSAWSAGGALITARPLLAGLGTQNAGLVFGGHAPGNLANSEEYNGSAWAAGGDLNSARTRLAGSGTQNAGLGFGGFISDDSALTEEYNGHVWTNSTDLITARRGLGGAGSQNATIAYGGRTPTLQNATEVYNGMSWVASANMITARNGMACAGTVNATLGAGGASPAADNKTEEFDGTTWSAGGNLGTARLQLAGAGSQTAALAAGGYISAKTAVSEEYDGLTWSATGDVIARWGVAGMGSQTSGLIAGGGVPGDSALTEEYNKAHSGASYLLTKKIKAQE